jgi:ADP-heptose:LPS heptosyltransferase
VVDEIYQDVLLRNQDVNEILGSPLRRKESIWVYVRRWLAFIRQLRAYRYDVAYDLTYTDRGALLTCLCKARRRVSYIVHERHWRHRLYDVLATWTEADYRTHHVLDFYLSPLRADGVPIVTRDVSMDVPAEDTAVAHGLLAQAFPTGDGPLVVVHPGARLVAKCWPPENFAAVCDMIARRFGGRVLLLTGQGEDPMVNALLASAQVKPATVGRPLPVPQLAALLKEADLFLGNDSGPMHVAAAVGTPVVALFGPQLPSRWGPLGEGHITLRPPDCAPCPYPAVCHPPDFAAMFCVRRITVGEVVNAVEQQLAKRVSNAVPNR